MPESLISPLDDRCFALENFVGNTGTQNAHWHSLRAPPSIRHGYGRAQAAIADSDRLKAAIYIPKVQDVDLPFPTTDGDGRFTKQRGKRARTRSEGIEEHHKQIPSPRKGSSIHYGVRFRQDLRKWVAEIRVAEWKEVDKKVWLGTFDTEEGAARGVDLARKLLKCTKKRPPNLPCPELDHYATKIPSHLDLTDIANDAMFKDVVSFIKNECQAYAARFPPTTTLLTPPVAPQLQSTPNSNNHLGYEEVDVLWNDDNFELNLSDCELILPGPPSDHQNTDPTVDELIMSDFDMAEIFEEAISPFGEFDSSSAGASAPSSFTGHQFGFQFQVQQNEIARGASLDHRQVAVAWEMEMEMEMEPVCHNLAVENNLPQTWPGATSPSTEAFQVPLNSELQSDQSPLYISSSDGGDMTFSNLTNCWILQSQQYQFQMDMAFDIAHSGVNVDHNLTAHVV